MTRRVPVYNHGNEHDTRLILHVFIYDDLSFQFISIYEVFISVALVI